MDNDLAVSSASALPSPNLDDGSRTPFAPLDSPTASTFLRTAETLDGLAQQLDEIRASSEESVGRCTCGAMLEEREGLEDKLKLSGGG